MRIKTNGIAITAITALIILALMPVLPVFAQTNSISTSKTSYAVGDSLVVTGTVSPVQAGQDVSIVVLGPTNELKAFAQVTPGSDGKFSQTVMVFGSTDPSGTWSAKATYMGVSSTATFSFVGAPVTPIKTTITVSLDVDGGTIHFGGETAEFYVLVSYQDSTLDASITPTIYGPTTLTPTSTKVATGLYKITVPITANANTGTYTLVFKATLVSDQYVGSGIVMKSFLISPKLGAIDTDLAAVKKVVTDANTAANAAKAAADAAGTKATAAETAAKAAQTTATTTGTKTDAALTAAQAATTAAQGAKTSVDSAISAANAAKAATDGLTTLVYASIGASLIAALAAIVALMQISKKIA